MSNNTKKEADLGNDRIGGLLFKLALPAILAQINVNAMQRIKTSRLGNPPITKCETAPVSAVKVMMNTLVPTAVFNS